MPEDRLPRKSLQYQPQGKRDLGRLVHVVAEWELNPKLRMEEEVCNSYWEINRKL